MNRGNVSKFHIWWLEVYKILKENDQVRMMNDIAYICWQVWKLGCEMVIEKKIVFKRQLCV